MTPTEIKVTRRGDRIYFHLRGPKGYVNLGLIEGDARKLSELLQGSLLVQNADSFLTLSDGGFSGDIRDE